MDNYQLKKKSRLNNKAKQTKKKKKRKNRNKKHKQNRMRAVYNLKAFTLTNQ